MKVKLRELLQDKEVKNDVVFSWIEVCLQSLQFGICIFLTTRSFCLGVIVLTLLIIVVIIHFLSFWNPIILESNHFGIQSFCNPNILKSNHFGIQSFWNPNSLEFNFGTFISFQIIWNHSNIIFHHFISFHFIPNILEKSNHFGIKSF